MAHPPTITFGSVCSGIEAASVALGPLGFVPAWLSEIDPFASAVLAHHYPAVPNLGDMTAIARRVLAGDVAAPDVLCGGTPCQAFSVAGLRNSLADARGNLTLKFVELADAIDHVRLAAGKPPAGILWENVPGVLSTKDNAFGCFLAGLAGEDEPLQPPGGRWANAGAVYGPARSVAWRTLDAQYFGVAQRRRRVFVVASARNGFDPAAVLFEWDGMRRDTAPSRETGKVAPTIPARSSGGGGLGTDFDCDGGVITMAHGQGGAEVARERRTTLTCNHEAPIAAYAVRTANTSANGHGIAEEVTHTLDQAQGQAVCVTGDITHTLKAEGFDASEDGTGRGTPLVPVAYATGLHNTTSNQSGKFYENYTASLDANSPPPAIVFDTTQITSPANVSNPKPGDPCHPLAAGAHAPTIAFPARMSATQHASTENLSPALGATNPTAVAVGTDTYNGAITGDIAATLGTRSGDGLSSGPSVMQASQVRRLTPTECERLQGFPDGYTAIPWRGKPSDACSDGPRYKALGNSWPVPVVRWIGARLARALRN